MNRYRVIYRDGTYRDVDQPPSQITWFRYNVWAVVNLAIVDGGDAYQALLRTLEAAE